MNITVRIPDDIVARLTEAGTNPEDLARAALSKAADTSPATASRPLA